MKWFRLNTIFAVGALGLCAGAWGSETAVQQAPSVPAAPKVQVAPTPRVHMVRGPQSAYLGVNIEEVTPDRVNSLKLKTGQTGVEITLVDQDAAAGKAGLRPHDVVVSVNGTPVEGEEQFRRLIRETPVGRGLQLGIVRDGQPMTLQATMGSRPMSHVFSFSGAMPKIAMMPEPPEPPEPPEIPEFFDSPSFEGFARGYTPRVGIVAESLTPQLAQYFGAKEGQGVLVRSVEKGSAAEQAGLKAGDVITKLNGEPVSGSNGLRRAFRGKGGSVSMMILRDKREQTLTLKLPEQRHGKLNGFDFDFDTIDIDMSGLDAAIKELEPQMEQIRLLAKNEALKTVNSEAFRKQMDEMRKEVERNRKELQKALRQWQ